MSFTPIPVLTQEPRSNADTSASVAVPTVDPDTGQPYTNVEITTSLSSSDCAVATNTCLITLLASWDQGTTFEAPFPAQGWQGGTGPKGNISDPPGMGPTIPMKSTDPNSPPRQPDFIAFRFDPLGNTLNLGGFIGFSSQ